MPKRKLNKLPLLRSESTAEYATLMTKLQEEIRPSGPIVSWVCEIGITPALLVNPTVGLIPTTPLALAGETIEPFVSVPIATAQKLAAGATPEPLT